MKRNICLIFAMSLTLIIAYPALSIDNNTLKNKSKTQSLNLTPPKKKIDVQTANDKTTTKPQKSEETQKHKSLNSDDKKTNETPQTIDTIPIWVTAVATLVLAFIALFQEGLKKWWTRPKLSAEFEKKGPWVHDLYLKKNGQTNLIRNYRLKVINNGRRSANKAEARIEKRGVVG